MEIKHPKYYAEMRAKRRKLQASSLKLQAPSDNQEKLQAQNDKPQAPSPKRQAQ
jgi:hypothetical protein